MKINRRLVDTKKGISRRPWSVNDHGVITNEDGWVGEARLSDATLIVDAVNVISDLLILVKRKEIK